MSFLSDQYHKCSGTCGTNVNTNTVRYHCIFCCQHTTNAGQTITVYRHQRTATLTGNLAAWYIWCIAPSSIYSCPNTLNCIPEAFNEIFIPFCFRFGISFSANRLQKSHRSDNFPEHFNIAFNISSASCFRVVFNFVHGMYHTLLTGPFR